MLARTQIIGNVGKDAELRQSNSGVSVLSFNVATTRIEKNEKETLWFKITLFNKIAQSLYPYIKKGTQIYVDGDIKIETWQDKQGVDKTTLCIIGQTVKLLGKRSNNNEEPIEQQKEKEVEIIDDLPF